MVCYLQQTSKEVSIEGMQPAVLKALLAYMYGCLSDIEPGMVHDLFRAADHYQVQNSHASFSLERPVLDLV